MAILVTGGAGYIGGHVIRELREAGEAGVVIDDLSSGYRAAVPPEVPLIVGDCGDQELVAATLEGHRVSAVIDLAGPAAGIGDTLRRIRNLVDVASRAGVAHFVLSSTAEVYGSGDPHVLAEDAPTVPVSARGRCALLSERMLAALAGPRGTRFVMLRLFDVVGTDPLSPGLAAGHAADLLPRAARAALGAEPHLEIPGTGYPTPDGTCVRDYVHVSDVARAYVAALGYLRAGGPSATFNCGSGQGHSVLEVAGAAERASGQGIPLRYLAARPDDAPYRVADIRRIRSTLGWAPRLDGLDLAAGHVVAWQQRLRQRQQDAAQAFSRIVAQSGVAAVRLQRLMAGFGSQQPVPQAMPATPHQVARERMPPGPSPLPTPPSGDARRLTIGMATRDDYDGVYFTLQALRFHHRAVLDDVEFIVVDGNPTGPCATALKDLESCSPNYRYVPHETTSGLAARDRIFQEARGRFVLSLDCHVLLAPGALARLMAHLEAAPDTDDLLQGPLVYDDLARVSTHLDPQWRDGAYGVTASDPAGADPDHPPFEITMQRLGLFACRRTAWPDALARFRGSGGEEGYLHETFRRRGGKVICLPFLRWTSRFARPLGTTSAARWDDRVANYLTGFRELGWDTAPVIGHYKALLGAQAWPAVARQLAARGVWLEETHAGTPDLVPAEQPAC